MHIAVTTQKNKTTDDGACLAQHKLRKQVFIDRLSYNTGSGSDLVRITTDGEIDCYDQDTALYVVVMEGRAALACCRLVPGTTALMVQDLWPELLGEFDPANSSVAEASRICVDERLPSTLRTQALDQLVAGVLSTAVSYGFRELVGVMPAPLFRRVLEARGCVISYPAEPISIDNKPTRAGVISVSESLLRRRKAALRAA